MAAVTTGRSLSSRIMGAVKSATLSGPRRDRWQQPDRVVAALELTDGQRVIDLGAGGGYFTYRLARAVGPAGRVYAVEPDGDLTPRIGARADRLGYANIVVHEPDGDDPPTLPEPVDLVLSVDAFHHLPEERVRFFAGLADALGTDGRVAIVEPYPRWYLFGHATEPEEIRSTLADAGYEVVAEHDFLRRQSFTVFIRR